MTNTTIDIVTAAVAAFALLAVHYADPYHSARHNISNLQCKRASTALMIVIDGMYAILFAAVAYGIETQVMWVALWVWRKTRKPQRRRL